MKSKIIIFLASLVLAQIFFVNIALAQPLNSSSAEIKSGLTPEQKTLIEGMQYKFQKDIFWEVFGITVGFLGVAVAIVLVLGYLRHKNLEDKIENQEKSHQESESKREEYFKGFITEQRDKHKELETELIQLIDKKFESKGKDLQEIVDQLDNKFKVRTNKLREQVRLEELFRIWFEHYYWHDKGVYVNELNILIEFLNKNLEYRINMLDLGLNAILISLEDAQSKRFLSEPGLYPKIEKLLKDIEVSESIKTIDNFNEKREDILEKAKIFLKPKPVERYM